MTHRWLLFAVLLLPACSRTPAPSTDGQVPVEGRVVGADGQPLPGVAVRLHAEEAGGITTISCVADDKGAFACSGKPGKYKVSVLSLKDGKADLVPPPYRSAKDTPLSLTVGPRGTKDAVLTLRRE